jgi:hypothetical protein
MALATFIIFLSLASMLPSQAFYCLQDRTDKSRIRFFILLVFLVAHNIIVFYPEHVAIPLFAREKLFILIEIAMSFYYAYFFYKSFAFQKLEDFLPANAVLIFSAAPLALLMFAPTLFKNNMELQSKIVILIPFVFSVYLIYSTSRLLIIRLKHPERKKEAEENIWLIIAAYISLLGWSLFPITSINNQNSLLITDMGFVLMIFTYATTTIIKANNHKAKVTSIIHELGQKNLEIESLKVRLMSLSDHSTSDLQPEDYVQIADEFKFNKSEIKIVEVLITKENLTYKEIGNEVCLSESSVKQYMATIKEKTNCEDRHQVRKKVLQLVVS